MKYNSNTLISTNDIECTFTLFLIMNAADPLRLMISLEACKLNNTKGTFNKQFISKMIHRISLKIMKEVEMFYIL